MMSLLFLHFFLLGLFSPGIYSIPLLHQVQISRPDLHTFNITAHGLGSANKTGSTHKVWLAWLSETDVRSSTVVDTIAISYGPSQWLTTEDGWYTQMSEASQLVVHPVTLVVASSPFRGSYTIVGESSWSNIVVDVDVRSQTLDAYSTGVAWRLTDIDNHYLFVVNVPCQIANIYRVQSKTPLAIQAGAVFVMDAFQFGSQGNYPTIATMPLSNNKILQQCQGSCLSDLECSGSMICRRSDFPTSTTPGCTVLPTAPETNGDGYCTTTMSRPPVGGHSGFQSLDSSKTIDGAADMGKHGVLIPTVQL